MNSRTGLFVAVFGADGAGKSALLDKLEIELRVHFPAIRRYHLRPHVGRHRALPPVTHPHANPARGVLLSVVKLVFWLADYWLGYVLAIRPAITTGGLVMFDRYFQDLLVDPRRYRFPASLLWLVRLIARAVPRADLAILLHAPANVLHRRKQEVSLAESERQVQVYLGLFRLLRNALVIDAARPSEDVATDVGNRLMAFYRGQTTNHAEADLCHPLS